MKTVALALLMLAVAGGSRVARADTIAVFHPSAINLTDQEAAAFAELLRGALAARAGAAVLGPTDPSLAGQLSPPPSSPLHAGRYVLSSVVRLGNVIVVRAWLMEGGAQRHHVEIEGRSLDDLSSVAHRIAAALLAGKTVEETRTVDNVTIKEAAPRNRTFTERRGGFYTMPVLAIGRGEFMEPGIAVGLQVRLDKPSHFYEIGAGFLIPSGSTDRPGIGGMYAELGVGRFLGGSNSAAYLTFGVSPRIWGAYGDAIMGFAPYAGVGAAIGRESSSSLFVDVRVAQNLVPLEVQDYVDEDLLGDGDGEKVFPTEIGLRLGILF